MKRFVWLLAAITLLAACSPSEDAVLVPKALTLLGQSLRDAEARTYFANQLAASETAEMSSAELRSPQTLKRITAALSAQGRAVSFAEVERAFDAWPNAYLSTLHFEKWKTSEAPIVAFVPEKTVKAITALDHDLRPLTLYARHRPDGFVLLLHEGEREAKGLEPLVEPIECEFEIDCDDGGGSPPPPTPPTPPTGDNLRVTVTLSKVVARDTEDVTPTWPFKPTDEFYTMGTVILAPQTTGIGVVKGYMSPMFKARKGSTYSPNQQVFTAVVAPGTLLGLEYTAKDEDLAKDGAALAAAAAAYAVAEQFYVWQRDVEVKGIYKLIKPMVAALTALAALDKDDTLGYAKYDLGTLQKDQSRTFVKTATFDQNDTEWWSEWDYDVTYTIRVVPTNASLTPLGNQP